MPILNITNLKDNEEAQIENNAQVNKIESIKINGSSLKPNNEKIIDIPLASEKDITDLFKEE